MNFKSILFFIGLCFVECTFADYMPSESTISLAGKEWRLRYKNETNDATIQEYVTQNDNLNKWNELVTFQKFKYKFPKEITPVFFGEKEMAALKAKCSDCKGHIIESTPEEALIELQVSVPADKQQDELQRIVKTPEGQIIVVHYAIRKSNMGDSERAKWTAALKGVK